MPMKFWDFHSDVGTSDRKYHWASNKKQVPILNGFLPKTKCNIDVLKSITTPAFIMTIENKLLPTERGQFTHLS